MKPLAAAIVMAAAVSGFAASQVITKEITYSQGSTTFKGVVAYDELTPGKRPGLIVMHEWWGLNDFAKEKAQELAQQGYVVLAADLYGDGRITTDRKAAAAMAGALRGTPLLRQRAVLAFATLSKMEQVDSTRIAAIGFCLGGTAVLELAYSGADVRGVVSFHGGLVSPKASDLAGLRSKFLILHGADDPGVAVDSIKNMQEALRGARADWQMVYFGNSVHGFTNPSNGSDHAKGVAYNPLAAGRSWTYMTGFLDEIFAPEAK